MFIISYRGFTRTQVVTLVADNPRCYISGYI